MSLPLSLAQLYGRTARSFGQVPAVWANDRTYSYEECWLRARKLAWLLSRRELQPGARVAVLEGNSIRGVDITLACHILGLVRVPLYARNSLDVHLAMIDSSRCDFVFLGSPYPDADRLIARLGNPSHYFVAAGDYEDMLVAAEMVEDVPDADPDRLAIIRHTGGSTGVPKGIANTERQWYDLGERVTSFKPTFQEGESFLHVAPLAHASGYYFSPAWLSGIRQVLTEDSSAQNVVHMLLEHRIEHALLPPVLLARVCQHALARGLNFPDVRCIAIGSAPLSSQDIQSAIKVFGADVLYQTYGTSEVVPITGMGPREWFGGDGIIRLLSAGRIRPQVDLKILDVSGTGLECSTGTVGEIVVREAGMIDGYLHNEEATRERFIDGWFRTGDLGSVTQSGFLQLVGRSDEMIISGGHNIYPRDLEGVILELDEVIDVVVFGVPDDAWGETPVAMCRVETGTSERRFTQSVRQHVSERLGSYVKPSRVIIGHHAFPLTVVGKPDRRALKAEYFRACQTDVK